MTRALPPAVVPRRHAPRARRAGPGRADRFWALRLLPLPGLAAAPGRVRAASARVGDTASAGLGEAAASAAAPDFLLLALAAALGLALVVSLVLLVLGLQAHRRSRTLARALQASRAEHHALRTLLDVGQWRTDAHHRLVAWRAPAAWADTAPGPATGTPLWEAFTPDSEAPHGLQAAVQQQAAFADVRVTVAGQVPDTPGLQLQGEPVLDAHGTFAGHVGTARPLGDGAATVLSDVLLALPLPVLRVVPPRAGRPPRLLQHNPAAAPWVRDPANPSWDALLGALPAGVGPALARALARPDGTPAEAPGGWALKVHPLPCTGARPGGADEALVVFQPPSHAAASDDAESFGYTVSHDLRAPIRVVEGFTKIVKEDYGHALDRVGVDHLDRVLAAAARMNSMIDALLALSQLSARPLARQPVNLSLLAGYIVDDLRRQSPERQVEVQIDAGLQCHGDATLMRVVLENLIGNAWKYTAKCPAARIWVEHGTHDGHPAVLVRDNGAGFDMRFADRLFGVFQRLHSANDFQGTGIGLATVRRILRRHGGDIWAEAEVDRGARFQFWL